MKRSDIKIGEEYAVNIYGWGADQRSNPAKAKVIRANVEHDRIVTVGTGRGSQPVKKHFTDGFEVGIVEGAQGAMKAGSTHVVEARNIHSTWEAFEQSQRDAREYERAVAKRKRDEEVADAVSKIERALNRGDEKSVEEHLRQYHSTLLGKLANAVMGEVARREGDGRLYAFNQPVESYHSNGNILKVSDVRQPLV